MPSIQIGEPLYERARARAAEAGFATLDDYVAEMLSDDVGDVPNFDHVFTPERLASIDRVSGNMRNGGRVYTQDEVDASLAAQREAWLAARKAGGPK